jgi:hypothetical protein
LRDGTSQIGLDRNADPERARAQPLGNPKDLLGPRILKDVLLDQAAPVNPDVAERWGRDGAGRTEELRSPLFHSRRRQIQESASRLEVKPC